MKRQTTIINLIGAPCAGKSTLAAGLFALMKKRYISVELVTEYAKDLIYDGIQSHDMDPYVVFAEQHRRIKRLEGKVDYVITDSPLFLSAFYASLSDTIPSSFERLVMDVACEFNNKVFMVLRNHPYDQTGRTQDENQAQMLHIKLVKYLESKIHFNKIIAGDDQPQNLFEFIMGEGKQNGLE